MSTLDRLTAWRSAIALGGAYFVVAALSVAFTRFDGGVAFIWGSSGLLLARLSQLPVSRWSAPLTTCGIAIFAMSTLFGLGLAAAPLMTVVNLSEPVIAALLLRRLVGRSVQIDTVGGVAWFVTASGIVAPAVSGVGGAILVSAFAHGTVALNWVHWFAAHGLGALLVTPVASVGMSGNAMRLRRRADVHQLFSTGTMLTLVACVTVLVFSQNRLPILFLPMLPMVFATMRGGKLGAIGSTIILAVVAGVFSAHGAGPVHLMRASVGARSIFLQAYIAYAALLVLPVAAILKQREGLTQRLAESEARYRSIADSLGDAVVDVAVDGTIRYASPATKTLTGFDPETLIGADARCLVHAEDAALVWAAHSDALTTVGRAFAAQYRGPDGDCWFEVSIRAVRSPTGEALGVVGSIRDVTMRKLEEQSLQREALTDALTGLPNRRAFHAALSASMDAVTSGTGMASVAIFDLDRFKGINDAYGHAAGDAVLVAVAQAVQSELRRTDRVSRIGGEEFAVLFVGLDPVEAEAAAARLQDRIRALRIPFADYQSLSVTISVGLSQIGPSTDIDALMRRADDALYDAKRAGRDCLRIAA